MHRWIAQHPVLTALMVVLTASGGVLGALFFSDEWSLTRRVGLGMMCGLGVGLINLMNRMLGAYEAEEPRD